MPFFGIAVDTLAAVGTFAQRTGAAILPVYQRRDASGTVRVVIEPELDLGEARKDPAASTALLTARIEEWIRRKPAQWLWAHRRFKNVTWPDERPAQLGTTPGFSATTSSMAASGGPPSSESAFFDSSLGTRPVRRSPSGKTSKMP